MNILIIGSGVIGLSTAFELALTGHKVKVITRNYEEGTSWVAGGMLAPFSEGLSGDLLEFSMESLSLYTDFITRLQEVSRHSLYYKRNGILRLFMNKEEENRIKAVLPFYRKLGVKFEELTAEELKNRESLLSPDCGGAVLFHDEGNVDAERLMDALLIACERLNISVEIDDISEIEKKGNRIECVRGYRNTYGADLYIFTTGAWSRSLLKLPVYPVKGQILKIKGHELERVYYSNIAYIIPKESHILVGATSEDAGFDSRTTLEGVGKLIEGATKTLPSLTDAELLDVKVGFRPATPDEKPILHKENNFILSVGHYRNGILWAPATARAVLDVVEKNQASKFFNLFSANRFNHQS